MSENDLLRRDVTVSIVISNYNYARYVGDAIRSALEQDHPHVQVVVVDDGSTDGSREVIRAFGDRITAVYKENGGQASAQNSGFRQTTGDVVIFLDADDVLHPTIVSRVAACFAADLNLAKVQYRLAVVDADLNPTGASKPAMDQRMPNGDVLPHVLRFGKHVAPPTSGNAFSAAALRHIMPIPEEAFQPAPDAFLKMDPDAFLKMAIPLCGPIRSLDEIGGLYRIHSQNDHLAGVRHGLDAAAVYRRRILWTLEVHRHVRQLAAHLGIQGFPERATEIIDANLAYTRLRSLWLDRERHPIESDRAWRLMGQILLAGLLDPQRSPRAKLRWIFHEGRKVLR